MSVGENWSLKQLYQLVSFCERYGSKEQHTQRHAAHQLIKLDHGIVAQLVDPISKISLYLSHALKAHYNECLQNEDIPALSGTHD